ncbi:MAG: DMT family transporter [bacterium]|nr:DMT family transporter [bacterium]
MSRSQWLQLTLLAGIWGGSFLFIRIAAPSFGPFPLVAARTLIAAAVLIGYGTLTGQRFWGELRQRWKPFLLLGLINSAIPFTLITAAELTLTASMASILNASTPFFAALVAAAWFGDPLTTRKVGGIALGIVGVVLVVGLSPLPLETRVLLSVLMMFGASLGYGTGANYAKAAFKGVNPLTLSIGQNLMAGVIMLPLAALNPPQGEIPLVAVVCVLLLGVVSTAIAYLISFHLLSRVSATSMATVTMLVPFFSVVWSAMFLQEPFGIGQLIGLLVIVFSITLITGTRLPFLPRRAEAAANANA